MKDDLPVNRYRSLCTRLRERIESAERNIASNERITQRVENVAMHGRKAIENIAHMCLVATEHGLGEIGIPKDAKKHWNAEVIFDRLEKKDLMVLPSPSRMAKSNDHRFNAVFSGTPEHNLTYRQLIELYRLFHDANHEANPYRTKDAESHYEALLPKLAKAIEQLRNFTWVHFIGIKGEAFAVDLKNNLGITAVTPLSKIEEMPPDLTDYRAPDPKPLPASMSGVRIPDFPQPAKAQPAKP